MTRIDAGVARKISVNRTFFAAAPSTADSSGRKAFHRTMLKIERQGEAMQIVLYSEKPLAIEEGRAHEVG